MILLVCALEGELGGFHADADTRVLAAGIGPVEAAIAVSRALCERRYEMVLCAGIAGAFPGAASVGDAVVVAQDGLELDRESGEPLALPSGACVVDAALSDAQLVARALALGFRSCRGITVTRPTTQEQTAQRLAKAGAEIESMEGFAVLRAASIAGVPAIQLRGISNIAGPPERAGWDFAAGSRALRTMLEAFLNVR